MTPNSPKRPVPPKPQRQGKPRGRKPSIGIVTRLALNLDEELTRMFEEEHQTLVAKHRDLDWTISATARTLLRDALTRAQQERAKTQLPSEPSTTSKP